MPVMEAFTRPSDRFYSLIV